MSKRNINGELVNIGGDQVNIMPSALSLGSAGGTTQIVGAIASATNGSSPTLQWTNATDGVVYIDSTPTSITTLPYSYCNTMGLQIVRISDIPSVTIPNTSGQHVVQVRFNTNNLNVKKYDDTNANTATRTPPNTIWGVCASFYNSLSNVPAFYWVNTVEYQAVGGASVAIQVPLTAQNFAITFSEILLIYPVNH